MQRTLSAWRPVPLLTGLLLAGCEPAPVGAQGVLLTDGADEARDGVMFGDHLDLGGGPGSIVVHPAEESVFVFDGAPPQNLIVISLDTTRRDRIGRYGGMGNTNFLDTVLSQSVVLDDHRSCSNWTLPSTTCAQTGLFPVNQGFWPGNNDGVTPDTPANIPTLATTLRDAGYATGLVTANLFISRLFPQGNGFQLHNPVPDARADVVTDLGLDMAVELEATGAPWYLHLHYYDPHAEYDPPPPYDQGVAELPAAPFDMASYSGVWGAVAAWPFLSPEQQYLILQYVNVLYGGELQFWDDQLARLWH